MIGRALFLLALFAALIAGYRLGKGKEIPPKFLTHIHPEREVAPTEYKSFAIVLYAHNDSPWCERTLRSLFEQDYDHFRLFFIDDASSDDTFAKAQQFVLDHNQEHRVMFVQNEQKLGPVASLYQAVEQCLDREIVFPCSARNFFALPTILSRLNQSFQNPDVWIAYGQAIQYPSYEIAPPPALQRGNYTESFLTAPHCFYSALFKQIPLEQLLETGTFSRDSASYLLPILHAAGGRFKTLSEPLLFENATRPLPAPQFPQSSPTNEPLAHFPSAPQTAPRADILLFSRDRPLQLFAALESIERRMSGFAKLTILYSASDNRYEQSYAQVQHAFPSAAFVKQGQHPEKDFKPLLLKAAFQSPSEYILFGTDESLVKEPVNLTQCMDAMRKTNASAFLLQIAQPNHIPVSTGIYAWNLEESALEMTLLRKSDLKEPLQSLRYQNPDQLKAAWAKTQPASPLALHYEQPKSLQLPLDETLTAEELLLKFNQKMKLDIDALQPELIAR